MRVGIIGSGTVGQHLGAGFVKHGHEVWVGTREPAKLADWAASLDESAGQRLALDPQGDRAPRDLPASTHATLAVGPEGGLSAHDLATLRAAGFHGLRLGPRILRTETAGLAALAAMQALLGDL